MKPFANIIAGEPIALADLKSDINPSDTNDVVGEFACATTKDAEDAVAAARAALPAWSRTTAQVRSDILAKAGGEIIARREELGQLLAREEGKTLAEATGEAARAGQILQFFAAEAMRLQGEKLPTLRPGVEVEVTREPVGVVGMITPWNFPIAIPAWKIAPALAFGNTVVLKPAELTPLSAWHLVDILNRSGLPKGVLNLVMGKGSWSDPQSSPASTRSPSPARCRPGARSRNRPSAV